MVRFMRLRKTPSAELKGLPFIGRETRPPSVTTEALFSRILLPPWQGRPRSLTVTKLGG